MDITANSQFARDTGGSAGYEQNYSAPMYQKQYQSDNRALESEGRPPKHQQS